jgi:hypothetical protein
LFFNLATALFRRNCTMSAAEKTATQKAHGGPEEPMPPILIALLYALASCFFLGSALCAFVFLQNRKPAWLITWEEEHRDAAGFDHDFSAYQFQQTQQQQVRPSWFKSRLNPNGFLIAAVGLLCASVGTFVVGHWQRTCFRAKHERWIWSLPQADRASVMQRAGLQAIAASMGRLGFDRLSMLSGS